LPPCIHGRTRAGKHVRRATRREGRAERTAERAARARRKRLCPAETGCGELPGHGGANLPRHARPHEPPSRPRRVPASKGFPPTPADPRPSLPIEKLAPPQLSARRRQTSSCGTSGSSPRSNASGKSGRPPLQRRRGKPPSSPGRQVNDSLTLFSGTF
ncbi:hypothetical protein EMIHUDRAFT_444385, partial [Emiliania huxleyi CCMP1516]|uniref:Uncharacterized protein n=2 Tax=Emiliania huxleyi TaxID=2903 RepID=A0A0D3JEC6_EMIH1